MTNFVIFGYFQVVISGHYDYSSPEIQKGLESLLFALENTTFIDPFYTESWLRDFLDYVQRYKDYSPIDISNERLFIEALNSVSIDFLHTFPMPLPPPSVRVAGLLSSFSD